MIEKIRKTYQLGFDLWGLGVFLIVMLPNFVWFGIPAPNDVLRRESITPAWDMAASVFQVLMVGSLCFLKNRKAEKFSWKRPLALGSAVCCLCYYAAWAFYYGGAVSAPVILGLCLFPCGAFFLFALERRNMVSLIPAALFALCHTVYGIVNFIIN